MIPEQLSGTFGDSHIYKNQVDGVNEQLSREVLHNLPTLLLGGEFLNVDKYWTDKKFDLDLFLTKISDEDFILNNYQSQSKISFPLSN